MSAISPADGTLAPVLVQQASTISCQVAYLDPAGVVPANGLTCRPQPLTCPGS
jgi:hypothetical protein